MKTDVVRRPAIGLILALAAIALFAVLQLGIAQAANPLPQPTILADGELFTTVVTPATFNPESDPFDELYALAGGDFVEGTHLISDSKPGDQGYNGGRWHLNVLKDGVPPAKYAGATSVGDIMAMGTLDDFESTDTYFECPLIPLRGSN